MIKLFRKIRYDLIEENKTGRYFKYAIGEIILVVIGILIALQINNWNENRKLNAQKQQYYQQLLEDLKKDKTYIESTITYFDSTITNYTKYLETFGESNLGIDEIYNNIFQLDVKSKLIEFNTSTIETMQNTGDIKLVPMFIRNKLIDLKRKQETTITVALKNTEGKNQLLQNATLLGGNDTLFERLKNQPEFAQKLHIEDNFPQLFLALEAVHLWKTVSAKQTLNSFQDILSENTELINLISEELDK
jgi:hypothetical protein